MSGIGAYLFAAGALAVQAAPAIAQAAESDPRQLIAIDAGPLAQVLDRLAARTSRTIDFDRRQLEGIESNGVHGRFDFAGALDAALAGTAVHYRRTPAGVVIGRVDPGDIVVTASSVFGASRTKTPIIDIPQSLQILSSKQLDEQNAFSLTDAMGRATGVSVITAGANQPAYAARGFRVTNLHVDDGAAIDMLSGATAQVTGAPDMGEYDRIEILRGADALFGGNGNPGASISMIRKEPGADPAMTLYASAGSWNDDRLEVDANLPLSADGRLRFRTDLVDSTTDYYYRLAYQQLQKAYGVLSFALTGRTLLTVGGSYENREGRDFNTGVPRYPDGSDVGLPRSFALTFPWAHYDSQRLELFGKFTQDIGASWHLKGGATYLSSRFNSRQAQFTNSAVNPTTMGIYGLPTVSRTLDPSTTRQLALDLTLTGSWRFFDVPIDTMIGADHQYLHSRSHNQVLSNYQYGIADLRTFDPNAFVDPFTTANPLRNAAYGMTSADRYDQTSTGIYGSIRVHFTNRLSIVGGGRYNILSFEQGSQSLLQAAIPLPDGTLFNVSQPSTLAYPKFTDRQFVPFGGAVFKLGRSTSLYASYADIYATNGGKLDRNLNQLPPAQGVNIEGGIKTAWNGGKLVGSLAVFDIRQRNLVTPDLTVNSPNPLCCYLPNGRNTSWGVEAEISGVISPGWLFSAGYTWDKNQAKYGETLGTFTPRNLFKLWTSYRLKGALSALTVGGSASVQSANYVTGLYNIRQFCNGAIVPHCGNGDVVYEFNDVQGAYALLDLRVAYDISRQLNIAVSVTNVTDRRYYATIGAPYAGSFYGQPRSVLIKLQGKF